MDDFLHIPCIGGPWDGRWPVVEANRSSLDVYQNNRPFDYQLGGAQLVDITRFCYERDRWMCRGGGFLEAWVPSGIDATQLINERVAEMFRGFCPEEHDHADRQENR